MQLSHIAFTVLGAIFGVFSASLSKALRYQAPDECKWIVLDAQTEEVALLCRLRTINSELENTNFSVIQPQHTVNLRIECSDALFFQSSLSTDSFQSLVELKDLAIEYCKIGNLTAGTFHGLRDLRNLTVKTHNTDWSSMTLEIAGGAFHELALLERLDLAENNIWVLPDKVFCALHNLKVLNLTLNRLRDVSNSGFGSSPERCGANLLFLHLANNSLDSVAPGAFSGLSRLQELQLQGNSISFLADRALEGLKSLVKLNLASNKLVSIPPELFADTLNIKEAHLQNNSINVLAPGLFNELNQLQILDLSQNELSTEWVNAATFTGLIRLVILDISHNHIARLEPSVFRDLNSLQILRLEHNNIENIPENTFASLYNLHTLILSHNKLRMIDGATFNGLYVLSLLSLDNNEIDRIHPNAFKNCSSLQDLHVNGNKLFQVPAALKDLELLKTLDLGENHIMTVADASFSSMKHLYGLRLTDNNIGNITKGTFDRMESLKILNLSKNKIPRIEPGTFDENTNLQAIRLDGNFLTDIGGLFARLPSLIWLNISDNRLEWFDYAMIPTGLKWLDIHSNQITEIGNYFEIESQLHLSTFDISHNKLTEISGSVIPDSVEILFLNDNRITKVQQYTFFKKPNLTRVDLNGNLISSLLQNALRISSVANTRNLPELYIAGNPYMCDCTMEWLKHINEPNTLRNQPRVSDLDHIYCRLPYNHGRVFMPLMEATTNQFLCDYNFHCFALCHCCDFDACDCKMLCPTNCTCYHDQPWNANVVDCTKTGYTTLPDQIPMDATELYLDGNTIRIVGSHSFIGRKKLYKLFLNNSNIEIIHNRTFNGLKALQILHLENNKISELKGYEFEGLDAIRELYLQNNQITSIHNATFTTLKTLRILHLNNNLLVEFSVWQFALNPSLHDLALADNPWSCECEFVDDFRSWLQDDSEKLKDAENLHCVYNETYEEGPYFINYNSSTCNNFTSKTIIQEKILQDYLPLLIGTLSVFLFVIILMLLVFVYRQEMRVWFHSRYGVRIFYKSDFDGDKDKLFDAFISYSSKDETFVAEELAPKLEHGTPPYKLCLHYRDFPVGAYIADTIVHAVESSKRTIMVLSENFIKSEWCRFEFKSAHHQVLKDRRRRLIVILLGDVPHKDLDPDIRLYLKTNTYLQWGDKYFWQKLRFALPDVPNNQRTQHNNANVSPRAVAIHI